MIIEFPSIFKLEFCDTLWIIPNAVLKSNLNPGALIMNVLLIIFGQDPIKKMTFSQIY